MEGKAININKKQHRGFQKGVSGNPLGKKPYTPEQKLIKKVTREFVAEFKEKLGESLPLITPVLIAKALEGDMPAIKEINDRVMGKAEQHADITSKGEKIGSIQELQDLNAKFDNFISKQDTTPSSDKH